ncbi:MAG: DUF3667 domain-containing protein [Bacteroidales bacterium]|nr:DUF3667 domain-containing protein [Bacteroidales bacterium]
MSERHSLEARARLFHIWQVLGFNPWKKPRKDKGKKSSRDFYKGAFDNIPFLNDDAKRTFTHLLVRPGHMIRDYINGDHERYLAPLTSLIVFYAFFALLSSVLQPVKDVKSDLPSVLNVRIDEDGKEDEIDDEDGGEANSELGLKIAGNTLEILKKGYIYLHLDQFPEEVDTKHEAALAALEGSLRSQGIPLFLGKFILLWLAMSMALRRYKPGMSACAAASAYTLCQFSFFMLFVLLVTFGKSTSIGVMLMLFLLMIDYKQWLGIGYRKALRLGLFTGIYYGLLYAVTLLLATGSVVLLAYLKA